MSKGIFPTSEIPVVTKNQLKMMYFLGLILSKVVSKSRIQSIIVQNQFNNQGIQKDITTVIEKDKILNTEITLLKNSDCDCENEEISRWSFPVLCILLLPIFAISVGFLIKGISEIPIDSMMIIGFIFNCFWYQETVP